jgi:hypothetical protein
MKGGIMSGKFYRQLFEVEVLSEGEPLNNVSLQDIDYEITDGHCSGIVKETVREEVTPERMAQLLKAQGSDPEFLLGEDEADEQLPESVCDDGSIAV